MAGYRGGYRGGFKKKKPAGQVEELGRVKLPRPEDREVLGIVTGLMGASRMMVKCKDGKDRLSRIPGKMKNKIWVREGDVVIIVPWEIQGDERADIVWRYTPIQARWLKERNFI